MGTEVFMISFGVSTRLSPGQLMQDKDLKILGKQS